MKRINLFSLLLCIAPYVSLYSMESQKVTASPEAINALGETLMEPLRLCIPLVNYINQGDVEQVAIFLKDQDRRLNLRSQVTLGISLLNQATIKGNTAIVQLLLNDGAHVSFNSVTLWEAVTREHVAIVKLLIAAGANVNMQRDFKNTPLHRAVKQNNVAMIKLLLEAQANTELRNSFDSTPLHIAVTEGNLAAVKLLIEAKCNVNAKSVVNGTAIQVAIGGFAKDNKRLVYMEILDCLRAAGARYEA